MIIVKDRKIKIRDERHFKEWRKEEGVKSLLDNDNIEISDFESLEDGGTYTLGPHIQQGTCKKCSRFGAITLIWLVLSWLTICLSLFLPLFHWIKLPPTRSSSSNNNNSWPGRMIS